MNGAVPVAHGVKGRCTVGESTLAVAAVGDDLAGYLMPCARALASKAFSPLRSYPVRWPMLVAAL